MVDVAIPRRALHRERLRIKTRLLDSGENVGCSHAVCALKSSRGFSRERLPQFGATLRHKRYTRVRVTPADGKTTTCHVRDTVGRLSNLPLDVRACSPHGIPGHGPGRTSQVRNWSLPARKTGS